MQEPPKPRAADAASAPAARWNSGASVPLILLGVTFIVSYSILVLVEDLPTWVRVLLWSEIVFTWLAFATEKLHEVATLARGLNEGRVRSLEGRSARNTTATPLQSLAPALKEAYETLP